MMIQEMWHVAYHIDLYSIPISASITSVARQNAAKTSEIRRKIWQNTVKSCEIPKNVWIIVSSPNHHLSPTHPQAKSWARRPGPLGSTKNPLKTPWGPGPGDLFRLCPGKRIVIA